MKKIAQIFAVLLLLVALSIVHYPLPAAAQQPTTVTVVLTVTNWAQTNYSIQVNGQYRYFTNPVTSANTQILVDTNETIGGTTSNLYSAFIMSRQPNITVSIPKVISSNTYTNGTNIYTNFFYVPATNKIQIQSLPGTLAAVFTAALGAGSNWASLVYTTNGPTPTNYDAVKVPPTGLGVDEQTNVLTGLVEWFNVNTNIASSVAVISSNAIWSNFVNAVTLANLSNFTKMVGTNATNFAYTIGANATNYSYNLYTNGTNYAQTNWLPYSNIVYTALTWTTNTFNSILRNVSYHDLGNLTGNTNSILLTNQGGVYRFYQQDNGGSLGGETAMYASDGTHKFFDNDSGFATSIIRKNGNIGLYIGDPTFNSGLTYINGPNDANYYTPDFAIQPASETINTWKPIAFNMSVMPCIAEGAFTNFFDQQHNSGTGASSGIDSVTIPGNAITNNGDTIVRNFVVSLADASSTSRVEISLAGGTDLVDTGSLTLIGAGFVTGTITITRTGGNAYLWTSLVNISGPATASVQQKGSTVSSFNSGSGWTNNSSFSFTLTGSVGSSDLIMMTDTVEYKPSHVWATFQ